MKALLALEDGRVFHGECFGASGERAGEVVFNTALTGYQEVLTDPSYAGQIVVMTCPQIGNYGVNREDVESHRVFVEGFVVREYSRHYSHWRAEASLSQYLAAAGVVGLTGVDTRAIVRHIRDRGAMRAYISSVTLNEELAVAKARSAPEMMGRDLASLVSCQHSYAWSKGTLGGSENQPLHVLAFDFGAKYNILKNLARTGCRVTVLPAHTSAEEALAMDPDGIFLSNGPGDPEPLKRVVSTVQKLIGRLPIFGVCLGHQILGLAFGGRTFKLKFGHRGGNQPVKNLITGGVEITTQNHGFAVEPETLPSEVQVTHLNLNDGTVEGMCHRTLPVFSVQYHPEASPGPHDAIYLFDDFLNAVRENR